MATITITNNVDLDALVNNVNDCVDKLDTLDMDEIRRVCEVAGEVAGEVSEHEDRLGTLDYDLAELTERFEREEDTYELRDDLDAAIADIARIERRLEDSEPTGELAEVKDAVERLTVGYAALSDSVSSLQRTVLEIVKGMSGTLAALETMHDGPFKG